MPFIFLYILKLSLSLGVVFLFYQLVLRKLTFYNWNRWYLFGYTILCFFIPFIDISPVLEKNEWTASNAVTWVPVIGEYKSNEINAAPVFNQYTSWNIISMILLAGMLLMILRLLFQLVSFRRMMRKAKAIPGDGMNLYQVDEEIMPFSFGNSIFINQRLHTTEELQEIIRHEFVHVKQRHSIDIIWSEILCMINWYNPFVWLLKRSIRQNLEFIADNKVLENGINKKQYQYLLLKVIGNNQFSIAPKFNFSSLKKRIAMMNKMKSAKKQLLRLLFLLPATAILLLAFRDKWDDVGKKKNPDNKVSIAGLIVDAKTMKPLAGANIFCKEKNISVQTDENGYYLLQLPYENKPLQFSLQISKDGFTTFHQQENWGNFSGDKIRELYGNTFEFFGLGNTEKKDYGFSAITGNAKTTEGLNYSEVLKRFERLSVDQIDIETVEGDTVPPPPPPPPVPPADTDDPIVKGFLKKNPSIKNINWIFNNYDANSQVLAVITKKDGTREEYNMNDPADKAKAEKKYGELPIAPPPPPPPPPVPPTEPKEVTEISASQEVNRSVISDDFEITDKKAVMRLKNGKTETYDLTNTVQRKKFEDKYGKLISVNANVNTNVDAVIAPVNTTIKGVTVTSVTAPKVSVTATGSTIAPAQITARTVQGTTIISDVSPTTVSGPVMAIDDNGYIITGKEDIVVTITRKTTPDQLEEFKKQMKEKGIVLQFDNTSYNKGILTHISGTMKYKDSHATFSGTDFDKVILGMIKDDDRIYFKVNVKDKEVI